MYKVVAVLAVLAFTALGYQVGYLHAQSQVKEVEAKLASIEKCFSYCVGLLFLTPDDNEEITRLVAEVGKCADLN